MKAPVRIAVLMVVLIGATLAGHHSFAPFDMEKTMSLTGVVKEFQWIRSSLVDPTRGEGQDRQGGGMEHRDRLCCKPHATRMEADRIEGR